MAHKSSKSEVSPQANEFIYFADRELMEKFVDPATVIKIDEAKRQIAEAAGVTVDEHIRLEIAMTFLVTF